MGEINHFEALKKPLRRVVSKAVIKNTQQLEELAN